MRCTIRALTIAALAALAFATACDEHRPFVPFNSMQVPGSSATNTFTSFDISFVDATTQRLYVSSRSTKAVAIFDVAQETALGSTPAIFRGAAGGVNPLAGPNGVTIAENKIWAGDGDSTVKVFDLGASPSAPPLVAAISTGGKLRADEMDFDSKDHILAVANDAEDVPFVTFISTTSQTVLGKILFDGTSAPDATQAGLGGVAFNPSNGKFLVSVVQVGSDPATGAIAEMDPLANKFTRSFPVTQCQPSGLAIGPSNKLAVACDPGAPPPVLFSPRSLILDANAGTVLATITQVGGTDEVWYNPGDNRFYFAARDMFVGTEPTTAVTPVLGVVDAGTNKWVQNLTTGTNAHSVAANPKNNHVYVPLRAGTVACGELSSVGCVGIYGFFQP